MKKTKQHKSKPSAPADKSAQVVRLCEAIAACRAVVDNWEHGDLALAARMCAAVVERARKGAPEAQELRQALARAKRALDGDSNDEEHDALFELVEASAECFAKLDDDARADEDAEGKLCYFNADGVRVEVPAHAQGACPNCGQWRYPTAKLYVDCVNDCAGRGFAPREVQP